MTVLLDGRGLYGVASYTIHPVLGEMHTAEAILNAKHYFNVRYETGRVQITSRRRVMFDGVISKLDFDFDNNELTVSLDEYIKLIDYEADLMDDGAGGYEITYTTQTISTILTAILADTSFSVGFVPTQTITELKGTNLTRTEWLYNLLAKTKAGIDANGNYTTVTGDIVSGEINCDLIINYDAMTVTIGVAGTTRNLSTSNVWYPISSDLTKHIITTPEFSDTVYKPNRIKVVGKATDDSVVEGEAYITAAGDLPIEVVFDESCTDAATCETKAANILNSYRKLSSLSIDVTPSLYEDGGIYLGQQVTITNPKELNNTYRLTEIEVTEEDLTLTLGNSKNWLVNQIRDLNRRVRTLERW